MRLPKILDNNLKYRRILLRVDLDVPLREQESKRAGEREGEKKWGVADDSRIVESLETINYLLEQKAKIILLSHLGRPEGKVMPEFSLAPVANKLQELLPKINVKFSPFAKASEGQANDQFSMGENQVVMLENLRFDPGEESNDPEFAKKLASNGDFYVNEAFATSHREHASIVGLPKLLPHTAGLRFLNEVENLTKVFENPPRPVITVLGGIKEDKLDYVKFFKRFSDEILIGGKLPEFIGKDNKGMVVAQLTSDREDIAEEAIVLFEEKIRKAKTIVLSGPMGKYEDENHRSGTERIFKAIANSSAFKIAGGGDTETAITRLAINEKFNWISVGGGAMLEFLAKRTLPGIEALL